MKRIAPFLIAALVVVTLAFGAKPALANHGTGLSLISATCNSTTHTLSAVITNVGGSGHTDAIAWLIAAPAHAFDQPSFVVGYGQIAVLTHSDSGFQTGVTVVVKNVSTGLHNNVNPIVSVTCAPGKIAGPARFTDGRLNDQDYGQSAAVYCEKGGITVYGYSGKWGSYLAFKVSKADLAKYPAKPAQNTLIIEKFGIRLYKLTSGEYQVNAVTDEPGKEYVFRWAGCPTS